MSVASPPDPPRDVCKVAAYGLIIYGSSTFRLFGGEVIPVPNMKLWPVWRTMFRSWDSKFWLFATLFVEWEYRCDRCASLILCYYSYMKASLVAFDSWSLGFSVSSSSLNILCIVFSVDLCKSSISADSDSVSGYLPFFLSSFVSLAPMGVVFSYRVNWATCHFRSMFDLCFWKEKTKFFGSCSISRRAG